MPPVWNHRTPRVPNRCSQSTSPGLSWLAAVWPRSGTPTAPRIPNPRSVKLRPFRTLRPMPSSARQWIRSVATPPCMMKSSMRWPTSLSTSAVTTAVLSPKHFRRPRATLYSPPPSQAWNCRAVRIRPSPGSRRSMISPSETSSKAQEPAGLRGRAMVGWLAFVLVSGKKQSCPNPNHQRGHPGSQAVGRTAISKGSTPAARAISFRASTSAVEKSSPPAASQRAAARASSWPGSMQPTLP